MDFDLYTKVIFEIDIQGQIKCYRLISQKLLDKKCDLYGDFLLQRGLLNV